MKRHALVFLSVLVTSLPAGCGGGGGSQVPPSPPPTLQNIPALTSIAPSGTIVGGPAVNLVLYGSNFENGATVQWNGTALTASWGSATQMTATIPASDIGTAGNAKITVTNPSPGGGTSAPQIFTIAAAPAATTLVKTVAGITAAQDIIWDAARGKLYASIASTDTSAPNAIISIDPVAGTQGTPIAAGNNPNLLSISSDSSYLWVGLDGDHAVERFLIPGLTKDLSFPVPLDSSNNPQQPVSLQAAPVSPHTVAIIAGNWGYSPVGNGIYVFDDAVQRPTYATADRTKGQMIDWIEWGSDDSTIYGSQYTTIDAGGVATLSVTSSGVSLTSYNGGQVGPPYFTQYDKNNGLLYSLGGAFNPANGSLLGTFDLPGFSRACTTDPVLARYYCVLEYSIGATDVSKCELWVYDLNSYALLDRVYFGVSAGTPPSSITGGPRRLVRWGNAGLALITGTQAYLGNGGLFLIDGAAINPNGVPDFSSGATSWPYGWVSSLTPQQATAGSGNVTLTIKGNNFSPDSTACWNCNYLQFQYLPTSYANSQQLNVTVPASLLVNPGPLSVSVFDANSNQFSTDSLTFTVSSASPTNGTEVKAIDLAGLAMAWDAGSGLLYVGVADYDGAYPNSIVAIDGNTGAVEKAQTVSPDPDFVSVSANGQYLYAAFAGATTMTQLQLPGLGSPVTWTLSNPSSSAVYWAGDMKAAPVSPHTTAVSLFNLESNPDETGGVVVYDDNVERPNFAPGWAGGQTVNALYDTLAWGSSDQTLTSACAPTDCFGTNVPMNPLYEFQIAASGATFLSANPFSFNEGEIHSDFGTGLIYSDDGNVANPATQAVVGSYNASGLVAPDSSLNRVFVLGQTAAQANTNNFTIESFDQKAYTLVSSITLENLQGSPFELIRWGSSGLAVLTQTGDATLPGMLYLIQDANVVSAAQTAVTPLLQQRELVQRRWKRISKVDIMKMVKARRASRLR